MGNRTDFCIDLIAFMGARTDTLQWGQISCSLLYLLLSISASREIRFFVRATACERHFCCRAQAQLGIFFFGTRSRSSSERACWIVDVRSVFVFCFCFPMFVYLLITVPYCTYPSRVKSLQYIRRPSSYKPHQPLSSFPACLAKHPFPFLPEIRSLRQVANELYGHIYSALATHFYAVIYLHHEDIDGHLLRLYNFNAVTSTSGHQ